MIRTSLILMAAMAFVGCQGNGLCGPNPFASYAAAPAQSDPWLMAAAPTIQLTRKAYNKELNWCALGDDWTANYQPVYRTENGTEMVRGFLTESAFLSRNVMLESTITEGADSWLSADLEFAVTRRLQVNATLPLNLTTEEIPYGSVGGRALLHDADGLIISTNLDVAFGSSMVDWTPTLNAWYDLASLGADKFAIQTSVGRQFLEHSPDQFTWNTGLSYSFALGTTGRWDAILETGRTDGDWLTSFGVVKPLQFLHPDLDVRAAVLHNWDDDDWAVNAGLNFRF